jgi:hypothetical protein
VFNGGAIAAVAAAFSTFSVVAVLQQAAAMAATAVLLYGACTYYSCWPTKLLRKKYDEATADGSPLAPGAAAGSGGPRYYY